MPAAFEDPSLHVLSHEAPFLTEREEWLLWARWFGERDPSAMEALVASHLRLVVGVAKPFARHLPNGDLRDLVSAGTSGLLAAIDQFDVSRGVRLGSYAKWAVRNAVLEHMRRNIAPTTFCGSRRAHKILFRTRRGLMEIEAERPELTGPERIDLYAARMGVEPGEIEGILSWLTSPFDLDAAGPAGPHDPRGGEEESSKDVLHAHALSESDPADEAARMDAAEWSRRVGEAMAVLDRRERRLIGLRHGGQGRQPALSDLFEEFGLRRERLRQIEADALFKMKRFLSSKYGADVEAAFERSFVPTGEAPAPAEGSVGTREAALLAALWLEPAGTCEDEDLDADSMFALFSEPFCGALLGRALSDLPNDQREVLSHRFLGPRARSAREAASSMGVPTPRVRALEAEARRSLRRFLLGCAEAFDEGAGARAEDARGAGGGGSRNGEGGD